MKIRSFLSLVAITAFSTINTANAVDFSDKFYGHIKIGIGASYQHIKGSDNNKNNYAPIINVGYNVYYRLNDIINPFIGLEVRTRIAISDRVYKDRTTRISHREILTMNANIGSKIKVSNNISIAPYGMVGFTYGDIVFNYTGIMTDDFYKYKVGFTTSAGIEAIISDRYYIGLEYRYCKSKFNIDNDDPHSGSVVEIKGHEAVVKFGVYFL